MGHLMAFLLLCIPASPSLLIFYSNKSPIQGESEFVQEAAQPTMAPQHFDSTPFSFQSISTAPCLRRLITTPAPNPIPTTSSPYAPSTHLHLRIPSSTSMHSHAAVTSIATFSGVQVPTPTTGKLHRLPNSFTSRITIQLPFPSTSCLRKQVISSSVPYIQASTTRTHLQISTSNYGTSSQVAAATFSG